MKNTSTELFIKSITVLKNMRFVWLVIPFVLFSVVGMTDSFGQAAQWSVQFGSDSFEEGRSVALDSSGNVYVTGTTMGSLFDVIAGESDAFVVKYDTDGNKVWAKQFGSIHREWGNSVALDSSGNVYVTGTTMGSLFDVIAGESDAYVVKYDTDGNKVWAKQFGSDLHDGSNDITIDSSGNVYVTGTTSGSISDINIGSDDAYVVKYDTDGNKVWAKQFGDDLLVEGIGITADSSGNVHVTGYAKGDLFGTNMGMVDAYVAKYDTDGTEVWAKQFGSDDRDIGFGIAADSSGNVHVTGHTNGDLFSRNTGAYDVFVVKYSPDGIEKWTKQFGNDSLEEHVGITTDSFDNVYVTGVINDNSSGNAIDSDDDVFVTKYAKNGIEKWTKQFGSDSFDGGNDIAVDSSGNVYVTGTTSGSLFDTLIGEYDAFVIKYDSQMITLQPSLKHQIESTIPIDDITCKNKDHLLVERTNEKLACVYLETAEKLDWKSTDSDVIILSQSVKELLLVRYQYMPEVVAFYTKYTDAQASVRDDHVSYVSGSDDELKIRMKLFFDENYTIIDKSLACYYKKAFQFESSPEDVLYRLQSNECKQSTANFDLSKIGEN